MACSWHALDVQDSASMHGLRACSNTLKTACANSRRTGTKLVAVSIHVHCTTLVLQWLPLGTLTKAIRAIQKHLRAKVGMNRSISTLGAFRNRRASALGTVPSTMTHWHCLPSSTVGPQQGIELPKPNSLQRCFNRMVEFRRTLQEAIT
eukprot:5159769-Amphidinium_carterae.3